MLVLEQLFLLLLVKHCKLDLVYEVLLVSIHSYEFSNAYMYAFHELAVCLDCLRVNQWRRQNAVCNMLHHILGQFNNVFYLF